MTPTPAARARRLGTAGAVLACALLARAAFGADADAAAGQRLFRDGLRASGEPLAAVVAGDVPVLGTQVTCARCHGRSGMGAAEGNITAPTVAGALLFASAPQSGRPAYDAASLARALREGIGAAGKPLNPLMPRYAITDDEIAQLAAYLRSLSIEPSPGVDAKTIHFATVVTDGVPAPRRDAVLAVLRTYFDEKNRQTRLESQRPAHGPTRDARLPSAFREWALDEWTLTGPSDTWDAQLELQYRATPVFAMLGGLAVGSWKPIGQFCEEHEIPCLFPSTELPDAEQNDFYTLYFSRGLDLEADLMASHIVASGVGSVIQVHCGGVPSRAASTLRAKLAAQSIAVEDVEFACERALPAQELAAHFSAEQNAAAVLWVRNAQLANLERPLPAGRLYVSTTLLERVFDDALRAAPGPVFAAQPFRAPNEPDVALRRFMAWAQTRDIAVDDPWRQAEAFFACIAANEAVMHLNRFFLRDYLLDTLDHAQGLAAYVPLYPRSTLGPGQRFINKGGYVVPLGGDHADAETTWIVP